MIESHFSGEKIVSNSSEAFSLHEKSSFGEKKESKIEYSLVEALFLVYENKMIIRSGKNILTPESFLKKLKKLDKKIETKLSVFSDLRKRGYVIKSALKFGAEFRVYDKGSRPGSEHARWILYTVREHNTLNWHNFAAKNRIAHSTKKNLLIAIVDEEGDVSYYEISWLRP
ncbi:tRNA-intron lyase [Candidatus Pacearchaeota archaeon]|nr:tRNA-intron lyase [Candidatus Pacearchaeota archaeon]